MVVHAVDAALHQPEKSFDCVGRDVTPILPAGVFFILVGHHIVICLLYTSDAADE